MNRVKMFVRKVLYPKRWLAILFSTISFALLFFVFATKDKESVLAYVVYAMSAYSLVILVIQIPALITGIKLRISNWKVTRLVSANPFVNRYFKDMSFRGSISVYQGMIVNFIYVIFRVVTAIKYASVWFISIAVYYLVLGIMRTYLIVKYRADSSYLDECKCYKKIGILLFVLNIPMGGMIAQMVAKNSGFSYPGYIIYLSAMYSFYILILSIINLVKYKKLGSPILSSAKVLNFVSAMMSILGLQTAMIAQFSNNGESYRKMMNGATGLIVWLVEIIIAVYMLAHSRKLEKEVEVVE